MSAVFVAVSARFQTEQVIQQTAEAARSGISYLERVGQRAGYGIDPQLAFDVAAAGLPGGTKSDFSGAGFTTDDLAFRYRDPTFLRRGSLAGSTLTLTAPFGVPLRAAQPVLVVCPGARNYYAGRLVAGVTAAALTANLADYGAPFPVAVPPCASVSGAAYVMLMYEVRVRVIPLGGRPFLVVFHNFQPIAGNTDFDPLAADVEDFQVAYFMNRPAAGSTCCAAAAPVDGATNLNWVLGDTGTVDLLPAVAGARPRYDTPYDDPTRFNDDVANIRAIRVSIVVRSSRKQPNAARTSTQFVLENHDPGAGVTAPGTEDGFYRTVMTSVIRTPNLLSRSFFIPPITAAAGDGLNLSGG